MSKKSLEIAKSILSTVEPTQEDMGWRFDLFNTLGQTYFGVEIVDAEYDIEFKDGEIAKGMHQEHVKTTKAKAREIVANQIADQIDNGTLVLGDAFIKEHSTEDEA